MSCCDVLEGNWESTLKVCHSGTGVTWSFGCNVSKVRRFSFVLGELCEVWENCTSARRLFGYDYDMRVSVEMSNRRTEQEKLIPMAGEN